MDGSNEWMHSEITSAVACFDSYDASRKTNWFVSRYFCDLKWFNFCMDLFLIRIHSFIRPWKRRIVLLPFILFYLSLRTLILLLLLLSSQTLHGLRFTCYLFASVYKQMERNTYQQALHIIIDSSRSSSSNNNNRQQWRIIIEIMDKLLNWMVLDFTDCAFERLQ